MGHLEEIQMSYCSHLFRAIRFGYLSFYAGVIFIVHGLVPDWFVHTGSDLIRDLNCELQEGVHLYV